MTVQNQVTKSVRLDPRDSEILALVSRNEGVSEAAVMKRFIRQGLSQFRLEQAITAYQQGEIDLSAAARHADISVYHMMTELEARDIEPPAAAEKFVDGLKTLVATFGGSEALHQTIADLDASEL